ncbi:MAG: flagellar protein FlaG [Gammaproteobacteria bacterium]|nr:flagellar protein FlaG [Gammaproteobacteria bacterium]MDH3429811.1 flagellar protein FlaG [Gammaproteobacteria bacterium]MDH3433171.1 flagellar protein FlaG [Gammaproteobacteria bacterium]
MSNEDIKSVSSVTGTFRQLRPQVGGSTATTGNEEPTPGKKLPVAEKSGPEIEALARKLNVASQSIGRDLRFEVNMDSGRSVIQVLDRETGEVIRQIPPEKASLYHSETGAVALRLYDRQV